MTGSRKSWCTGVIRHSTACFEKVGFFGLSVIPAIISFSAFLWTIIQTEECCWMKVEKAAQALKDSVLRLVLERRYIKIKAGIGTKSGVCAVVDECCFYPCKI